MIGLFRAWRRRVMLTAIRLRYVYPFYWAHHPLCDRFRRDVLRLGRMHVCRSCALVYAGLILTILGCLVYSAEISPVASSLFALLVAVTLAGSCPIWYRRWPRPVRDLFRAMLGMTLGLCGFLLTHQFWPLGLTGLIVLLVSYQVYFVLRQAQRLRACDGCLELDQPGICSGCRLKVELTRQYETAATAWLLTDGYVPTPGVCPRSEVSSVTKS